MSFQNKSFWLPRDAGCLTDGEMGYDASSRIEQKHAHQWFMDASEPELFCNNKQAIEAVNSRTQSGISNANISLWENTSSFQSASAQFTDRLFGSEPVRTFNLVGRNIPSVGTGNLNMERKSFEDQFGNDSSVDLSMSHTMEDPSSCLNYAGLGKVKVNQVRDSENDMSVSMRHSYTKEDNNTISMGNTYNKSDKNISLGPTYSKRDESTISMAPTYDKGNGNFISVDHTFNKGDGNFMLMGHNYSKGDDRILSMGLPFDKGDCNFISIGQRYEKGDGNIISMSPAYNKGHENFISMGPSYNKANESFISTGPPYGKGDDNIISMGPTHDKADTSVVLMGTTYDKGDRSILSMGQNYNKGEGSTISFGGFQNGPETNPSGRIIYSYDLLSQPSAEISNAPGQKDSVEHNAEPIVSVAPAAGPRTETIPKNKEQKMPKKVPSNNFPSNVKSLLSTGMLDGVPVKYVSWSREKNLRGVIKGTGYLCGCDDCKLSKALNAYEFERHTGCKTKHPNNHIYFENGKTIYAVVQELKSTPQDMLFDAIQNVTGSPINQKNFRIWKASYQAATRELQRIYGKEEVIMPT
uniref:Tify domain-containing protein n=1 Tax=Davidia involucrata TaxID=16924 RepID=A0A5B7A3P0_DAVIN